MYKIAFQTIAPSPGTHAFVNTFIYGLLYGPIALPCSGSLVVRIFALSLTVNEALSKLNIFFWFGMGIHDLASNWALICIFFTQGK